MGTDPLPLDPAIVTALAGVSTATLTTVLLKKGLRNVWMRGTRPLAAGQPRVVGRAFTLRFVPAGEDLATPASWASPISTRAAIEAMPAGCVAVVDATTPGCAIRLDLSRLPPPAWATSASPSTGRFPSGSRRSRRPSRA